MEKTKMKIQISSVKKVEDALVVWPEELPEVDIVMDPRPPHGLKFKSESISAIYCFDLFGICQPEHAVSVFENIRRILKKGGELYIIDHDFDYINRSYIGGDIPLKEFNENFRRSTYVNQEILVGWLCAVGFNIENIKIWFDGLKFPRAHYEIILSAIKN